MGFIGPPVKAVICALLTAAVIGCADGPGTTGPVAGEPAEAGDPSHALVDLLEGPLDDPQLQGYISGIGGRLDAARIDRSKPCRFLLVRSSRINALADPQGRVLVCAGLIDAMPSQRALAAVLAHEIGHVQAGHSGALMALDRGELSPAQRRAMTLLQRRFTPAQEHQADAIAVRLLARGGMDPRGLVEALGVLRRRRGAATDGETSRFRTHPLTTERIRRARRLTEMLSPVRLAEPPYQTRRQFRAMQRRLILWRISYGMRSHEDDLRDWVRSSPRQKRQLTWAPR